MINVSASVHDPGTVTWNENPISCISKSIQLHTKIKIINHSGNK